MKKITIRLSENIVEMKKKTGLTYKQLILLGIKFKEIIEEIEKLRKEIRLLKYELENLNYGRKSRYVRIY